MVEKKLNQNITFFLIFNNLKKFTTYKSSAICLRNMEKT